jgi:deoxyribonuclease-4
MESIVSSGSTLLLLEATAGQGSSVGHRFEHLGYIIERVKSKIPIGVCIDTCHIFAAGYDIRTQEAIDQTLKEFEEKVGLLHLHAFHLNDSLKGLGSRVDRHADIGKGLIGLEAFKILMTHPLTSYQPKYLETPSGPPGWTEEIALLKDFAKGA